MEAPPMSEEKHTKKQLFLSPFQQKYVARLAFYESWSKMLFLPYYNYMVPYGINQQIFNINKIYD